MIKMIFESVSNQKSKSIIKIIV